jgi:hypothetical protein
MLNKMQEKGLHIGANTHDADGIRANEKTYTEVCKALGRSPGPDLEFDLYNKSFAAALEDIVVRALDTKDGVQGIDFSWIDYQQGERNTLADIHIPNINPTIVLNMLRSSDPSRHGEDRRSMILSRWGGLGNHRYPVGFSGDQHHTWNALAFLPYFTSTSANVAFNYWSHDTVGGSGGLSKDYELSVRWVQTSAWSPVFRFHDKGEATGDCAMDDTCAKVVPWDVPTPFFEAIREASQVRDQLLPYMYTAAFSTIDTGLALVRPMYYEDPTDDALYGLDKQYLFGPDMVISPITQPSGPHAIGFGQALGAVQWKVFAPKSTIWVDRLNGDFYSGESSNSAYGIRDVPGFAKQGAVIPMRPRSSGSLMARAMKPLDMLEFRIMPAEPFYSATGSFSASGMVIDDDGLSTGYQRNQFSKTVCSYTYDRGTFTINVSQTGDFKGRPTSATLRISFMQLPPMVWNHERMGSVFMTPYDLAYDHELMGSVLTLQNIDLAEKPISFQMSIQSVYNAQHLKNFVGSLGRVRRARYVKGALDDLNIAYGDNRCNLTAYALAAVHMTPSFADSLPSLWNDAVGQVSTTFQAMALKKDWRRAQFVSTMMMNSQSPQWIPQALS